MSDIPKKLCDALVEGEVVPFVGAGVSMAVQRRDGTGRLFPSWKELLSAAADRLERECQDEYMLVRGHLKQAIPQYLEAAKAASEGLHALWPAFFREELDPFREDVDESTLELAKLVWGLGSKVVITTNYDRVLRWTAGPDVTTVPITEPASQVDFHRGNIRRPTVWHIHGSVDNPSRVILTPDGYSKLYVGDVEKEYASALETLRHMMISKHLLFIGFSLDDEYIINLLREIDSQYARYGGPHYVLAREADIPAMRMKTQGLGISFIPFQDFGDPLIERVRQLVGLRDPSMRSPTAPPAPPSSKEEPPIQASQPTPDDLTSQTSAAVRGNPQKIKSSAKPSRAAAEEREEWNANELGGQTAAAARGNRPMIAAIAEITGNSEDEVAIKLGEADGRNRVRGVFADSWPTEADEDEEWDLEELAVQRAATARVDETMIRAIAELIGSNEATVARKLAQADGRARVRGVFMDDWPAAVDDDDEEWDVDELGGQTAAAARTNSAMIGTIAEITGESPSVVLLRLEESDGRKRVRAVFAGSWPDVAAADDDGDEWHVVELGVQRAATARANESMIRAIAKIIEDSEAAVARKLAQVDGRARVRGVFGDNWPNVAEADNEEWDVDELGGQTAAAARNDMSMIAQIAAITGKPESAIALILKQADGRNRVRGLFADSWPEDDGDDGEWDIEELGAQRAATARNEVSMIRAIADTIESDEAIVARRLADADGRSRVRGVFEDEWPDADEDDGEWDIDELGGQTAAAARYDRGMIAAIAAATGKSEDVVALKLGEVDGRSRVRGVFADSWPETRDEGNAEWDVGELGVQRAATARADASMIRAIANIVGDNESTVARKLVQADGRARVRGVFGGSWPDGVEDEREEWDVDELGGQTAAAARNDSDMIAAIAKATRLAQAVVAYNLTKVDGRARVRGVFAAEWPESTRVAGGTPPEWDIDELGSQTAAAARGDEDMIAAIADVTGKSHRFVSRTLARVDGRSRVRGLFAESWPSSEPQDPLTVEIGDLTAASVRFDIEMIAKIASICQLDTSKVARTLAGVDGRTRVRSVFYGYWPGNT